MGRVIVFYPYICAAVRSLCMVILRMTVFFCGKLGLLLLSTLLKNKAVLSSFIYSLFFFCNTGLLGGYSIKLIWKKKRRERHLPERNNPLDLLLNFC